MVCPDASREVSVQEGGAAHQLAVPLSVPDVVVLDVSQVAHDAEALHACPKGSDMSRKQNASAEPPSMQEMARMQAD